MGQTGSNFLTDGIIPDKIGLINSEIRNKSKLLQELNELTYDDFKKYIDEINDLSRSCTFPDGRQLVFTVKQGTDTSFLWKAKIRIACIKFNPTTNRIESCTVMNFQQFKQLFTNLQNHLETMIQSEKQQLTASFQQNLMDNACGSSLSDICEFDGSVAEECCICLDRKPDMILPCMHLFCEKCITQWNSNSKTCPVCQEKLDGDDDGWVISEFPEACEISNEIRDSLQSISDGM